LFVSAGAQNVGGVRSGTGDSGTNTLTVEDLDAIKREVPSVSMVTPAINARAQLVAGNMNWNTSVQGVSEQYPDVRKWAVQSGSFFTDADVRTAIFNLQSSAELVSVARSNIDLAAETLTQSIDRFAAGVTDTVEVVQSQEAVASANEQYISSLYNYNYAKISLARAVGQAELGVKEYFKGK